MTPPSLPFRLPSCPSSIQKGVPLKAVLGSEAVDCLAHNVRLVHPAFDEAGFRRAALDGLEPLGILERGAWLAACLRRHLPDRYETALRILMDSLTPPLIQTESFGLGVFFYLPHVAFVATFGQDAAGNGGADPFPASMQAQYELTRRFSAEFSIRPFLIHQPERTLAVLHAWTSDPDPHVRRLCSEGTRPRLPWAPRLHAFIADPSPTLPILDALRDDASLYVRRSVANHVGDIAKDHPEIAFALCERWLADASPEVGWVIRHALRHPARKGIPAAICLRAAAKIR